MELEFLYSRTLHQKLKERIRGSVFTRIEGDDLKIRIETSDYWFETSYINIGERIIRGLSTQQIADEVLEKYKKFLVHRMEQKYFKEAQAV